MRPTKFALALGLAALALSACAPTGQPTATPSATAVADDGDAYSLVVLGDSLSVDPPHDCNGCVTYVAQFADALSEQLGQSVVIHNEARPDTGIFDTQRGLVGGVLDDLPAADLVLVWIGTNDGPPWPGNSQCGSVDDDTLDSTIAGVEGYTPDCIAATIAEYATASSTLYADIAAASPDAQHIALGVYDNWRANPVLQETTFDTARVEAVLEKVATIFDDWNAAQCAAAEGAGFVCVDTYHLANGADGRGVLGDFVSDDYTHLSQSGHDAVAALLTAEVDPAR